MTLRMAARSPAWASEMTSRTPPSPRARSAAQEAGPERLVLAVADVDAEDLALPAGGDPGGDDHGAGHDLAEGVVADVDVGGIQVHVREPDVAEGAVAERGDALVEAGADPRHLRLLDAALDAHRFDQVVDRPSRDALDVGLHHHRVQRLIDAPARLQQRREERPGRSFGMPTWRSPAFVDSTRGR